MSQIINCMRDCTCLPIPEYLDLVDLQVNTFTCIKPNLDLKLAQPKMFLSLLDTQPTVKWTSKKLIYYSLSATLSKLLNI